MSPQQRRWLAFASGLLILLSVVVGISTAVGFTVPAPQRVFGDGYAPVGVSVGTFRLDFPSGHLYGIDSYTPENLTHATVSIVRVVPIINGRRESGLPVGFFGCTKFGGSRAPLTMSRISAIRFKLLSSSLKLPPAGVAQCSRRAYSVMAIGIARTPLRGSVQLTGVDVTYLAADGHRATVRLTTRQFGGRLLGNGVWEI